jgi:hypothetical protein
MCIADEGAECAGGKACRLDGFLEAQVPLNCLCCFVLEAYRRERGLYD